MEPRRPPEDGVLAVSGTEAAHEKRPTPTRHRTGRSHRTGGGPTDGYLATLSDPALSREVDLSAMGMGKQMVGFVWDNALIGHAYCHCGEISALKGVQGKKGYPF